jgi:phosphoribosyl 1,2-cyclic phosphate phosphodiesterase
MKLQLLGTAAGEGIPGVFCGCETCRRVRASGGKSLRSRSSLQIDDVFKIDLPPDTHYHILRFGIDLSKLKYLFFTHSHFDHLLAHQLKHTVEPYAYNIENVPIRVFGNEAVIGKIGEKMNEKIPLELNLVKPFMPIQADYLKFTPLPANHAPSEEAVNYIIQSDSASALYACDTGPYPDSTYEFLSSYKFDLVIMECTHGPKDRPFSKHMTWQNVLDARDRMAGMGVVGPNTQMAITHFSHNGGVLHEEFEAITEPEGIGVCYDGITFEV